MRYVFATGMGIAMLLAALAPREALAQANMRRDGSLTLTQAANDTRGFYSATIDPTNGFAYFGAREAFKVDITGPLPVQVGAGVSLGGGQAASAVMDATAAQPCVYFAVGNNIVRVLVNGTNAPTSGSTMADPFSGSPFVGSLQIDTSDPANHYLYAVAETGGTTSTLYKIALNQFPNASAVVGSASVNAGEPALYYSAIDLTNRYLYAGTFLANDQPYIVKFALGAGANAPARVGGVALDTTIRSVGGMALDIEHGYGYCASDGNDANFGMGRVYMFALNGSGPPLLVTNVDMRANEGYCHEAVIKPDRGLLYFGSDLSYPGQVYRFKLSATGGPPVETGALSCLNTTNAIVPAWGTNPTNTSDWGEVFLHSVAYDPVRDYAYFGRDCADAQLQPYTNQVVKVALDRDEMMLSLTDGGSPNLNGANTIPYRESFEEFTNGFNLTASNGWSADNAAMAVVVTNADSYPGIFPIAGPHDFSVQVDGAATNGFSASTYSNVWLDVVVQAKWWTDPILPSPTNTPFVMIVTTNGHVAVWNQTNAPAPGNGWTELLDTSVTSNEYIRLSVQAAYTRDASGRFYYRVWLNGVPSANPRAWYATADSSQNSFSGVVAQGHFVMGDLAVTFPALSLARQPQIAGANVTLTSAGLPGIPQVLSASGGLSPAPAWQIISTNIADANGMVQFTDTNGFGGAARFYRTALP